MASNMNAIELLNLGDVGRTKPYVNYYWPEILGVTFGVLTGVFMNFGTRRPLFSGIHKHALGVIGWTSGLKYLHNLREDYLYEKDAVLRHYVELHPDDFPIAERKKYADVFEPWVPVR